MRAARTGGRPGSSAIRIAAARDLQPLGGLPADGLPLLIGEGPFEGGEQRGSPELGERAAAGGEGGEQKAELGLA